MTASGDAVAVVTYSLATGGSERVAADIGRHLVSKGNRVTVYATHGGVGAVGRALEEAGISCCALEPGPGGRLGRAWRLYRRLRADRVRVLHVHHFNMLSTVYRPARWAGVRRIVVTEHSDYQMRNRPAAMRRARRFGPRADAVTVVHEGLARFLRTETGIAPGDIRVIPNGVDTTTFIPGDRRRARGRVGLPATGLIVGSVGRLHPDKDPINFVEAIARLPEGLRAEVTVVIVGDGALRDEVQAVVRRRGLEQQVVLLGERHDIPDLLHAMDIFVLPSRTEGLPVALLEAMSTGLPVVATDVGGVAAAVEDAGLVVPPSDPSALAAALSRLLADETRRTELGLRGRQRAVDHYDRSVMFAAYERVLLEETPC